MHVRKASRGGSGRLRLYQPDIVKFAKVFAVANFHFALNRLFHVGSFAIGEQTPLHRFDFEVTRDIRNLD
jgi:hypothetical protein